MQTSKVKIDDNQDKVATTLKGMATSEHDKIQSRTTGRMCEISFGPIGGGYVPKNPFLSLSQARFAHANPEKFGGDKGLKEWDSSTSFDKIPKRIKT